MPSLLLAALSLKCTHSSCQSHTRFWTHLHHLFLPPVQLENTFCSFFLCSASHIFCFFSAVICVSNLYRLSSRFLTGLPGPSLSGCPFLSCLLTLSCQFNLPKLLGVALFVAVLGWKLLWGKLPTPGGRSCLADGQPWKQALSLASLPAYVHRLCF